MKKIVTILLITSLYSPQIAQFLSFSNCAIMATFSIDVSLCDCLKETNRDYKFTDGTLQSQLKNTTVKADWNYTSKHNFKITIQPTLKQKNNHFSYYSQMLPNTETASVFRPPC